MPLRTTLVYGTLEDLPGDTPTAMAIGRAARLRDPVIAETLGVDPALIHAMVKRAAPGDGGTIASTWVGDRKVILGVLPEHCSRYNSPSRAWAVASLARKGGRKNTAIVLAVDTAAHAKAAVLATARAFPLFDATTGRVRARTVHLAVQASDGPLDDGDFQLGIDGVRLAARLVDTPCADMHTDAMVAEAAKVAEEVGAECLVLNGAALRQAGLGGLWGVGKAAVHGPALVVLDWNPEGATRSVAWVGKGIVYDTGGLSIKSKTGMPGMKGDMAGAAAVLGAFRAAAGAKVDYRISAVLCLAENAVGPVSVRPDDILKLYSGKTVEINNTDAEGRLVLADGVAWVSANRKPDAIIDLATLTGAALVATGKVHAALYCNDPALESAAVTAGRAVGEPCHPLLYAPELFRKEFKSPVADMKNSVKDRANAQSSCAGQFIANHLPTPAPRWLHIDIAGPAWDSDDRGTGYGVGLLVGIGAGPA